MSDAPEIIMGTQLPDVDRWSERVTVALAQNPSAFTGPGTNTYLVGTGRRRILLDTGSGHEEYLPFLEQAMEQAGCEGIEQIVLTHGHPDHIGGVESVMRRFGEVPVKKHPWPETDAQYGFDILPIADADVIETEGARLRAIFTPGHCCDHMCFCLEQEQSIFSGDNVLGVGTTVIPAVGGSLLEYMQSLDRLERERPARIYPAHGPCIQDGTAKVRQYIHHRLEREKQIIAAMPEDGTACSVISIVRTVYAAYPETLYPAAGQSVTSHLQKLADEGRVTRLGPDGASALDMEWRLEPA